MELAILERHLGQSGTANRALRRLRDVGLLQPNPKALTNGVTKACPNPDQTLTKRVTKLRASIPVVPEVPVVPQVPDVPVIPNIGPWPVWGQVPGCVTWTTFRPEPAGSVLHVAAMT